MTIENPTPEQQLNTMMNQMLNTYPLFGSDGVEMQQLSALSYLRWVTNNHHTVQERYQEIRKQYLQDIGWLLSSVEMIQPRKRFEVRIFVHAIKEHDEVFTYDREAPQWTSDLRLAVPFKF